MNISILHGGHSEISHGKGDPEEFVLEAIKIGLGEFGVSEHLPHPNREDCLYPTENQQYQEGKNRLWRDYGKRIIDLRKKYHLKINILLGCEIDFFGVNISSWQKETLMNALPDGVSYDYFIGSVHFLDGIGFDLNPETFRQLLTKYNGNIEEVYRAYFLAVQEMVNTMDIDIVGHLGSINRMQKAHTDFIAPDGFNNIEGESDLSKIIRDTLEMIKAKNICLDVNAGSLRNPLCEEVHPHAQILKYARKIDIPVTLGTDSHQPSDVGSGLNILLETLARTGYTEYATFFERERKMMPLP